MAVLAAPATARSAAQLFTTRAFRPLLAGGSSPALDVIVHGLRTDLDMPIGSTNADVVAAAYETLAQSYRNEYVYKNLIANKIFVGRHRARNSVLLNEFAIGGSIADALFVNGEATVYEIKTELDNPDKLLRQLGDYFLVAPVVYVVVHERAAESYAESLAGTSAGLIAVGSRWRLSTARVAEPSTESLCVRTMINTLRVAEVEIALSSLGVDLPHVPNGRRYAAYLEAAMQFRPTDFHLAWRLAIKTRQLRGEIALHLDPALYPLRALLTHLDPGTVQSSNLRAWLAARG